MVLFQQRTRKWINIGTVNLKEMSIILSFVHTQQIFSFTRSQVSGDYEIFATEFWLLTHCQSIETRLTVDKFTACWKPRVPYGFTKYAQNSTLKMCERNHLWSHSFVFKNELFFMLSVVKNSQLRIGIEWEYSKNQHTNL